MYLHEDLEKGYFTSDRKKYFYDGSLENPQLWLTVNWDRLQSRNVSQHSQVSTSQADSYITSWSGVPLHLWRLYQHFRRDALSWCRASQWSPHHLAPPCYIVTGAPPIKAGRPAQRRSTKMHFGSSHAHLCATDRLIQKKTALPLKQNFASSPASGF